MESCPSLSCFLKRLVLLTLAGAAVLMFAAPILAFLTTVAACAIVGFLVWLPLHTMFFGRHNVWRSVCEHARGWRKPVEIRVMAVQSKVNEASARWISALRAALLEAACGAAVGILVAAAANAEPPVGGLAIMLGGAAGLAVALGRR